MKRLALLALLCGCRQIFGLHELGDDGADGPTGNSVSEGGGIAFAGTTVGGTTAYGAIEPDTFVPQGLHVRAYNQTGVVQVDTDPSTLDLGVPDAEVYGFPNGKSWSGLPPGLAVADPDLYTLVFDGEVLLSPGDTEITLDAKGLAVFELGPDASPIAVEDTSASITVHADVRGWYPVVGAFASPGGGGKVALSADAGVPLRARTTDAHGLHETVAAKGELENVVGPALLGHGAFDLADVTPSTYGLASHYSVRFQGQLLVEQAGMHTLSAQVQGGDRVRIFVDGHEPVTSWLDEAPAATAVMLDAGWHALAVDYSHDVNSASLQVAMDGTPIPTRALRPTQPQAYQVVGGGLCPLTSGMMATCNVIVPAPVERVIDGLDAAITISGTRPSAVQLNHDSLQDVIPLGSTPNEQQDALNPYDYVASIPTFVDDGAGGPWSFVVPLVAGSGTLVPQLLLRGHGGPGAPFSDAVTYTSPVFSVPAGKRIMGIFANSTGAGTGATVTYALRTGDRATLESESFVDTPLGTPFDGDTGEALQYRVTIAGDGWTWAAVTLVSVVFE